MKHLSNWAELQRLVALVDRRAPCFSTNIFVTADQFVKWQTPVQAIAAEGAVLIFYPETGFMRLLHAAKDNAALTAALRLLPKSVYVTDIIAKEPALSGMARAYKANGFDQHATLVRMSRMQVPAAAGHPHESSGQTVSQIAVNAATAEDAASVALMLNRQLDPWVERVPARDDLNLAASAGRLLVSKRDDRVTGMLMFEEKGALAHLQYWHVDQDCLGQGIGGAIMQAFLERCAQARRIVLWVIGDNVRSLAIYRRYGFAEDGLLDAILVLNEGAPP